MNTSTHVVTIPIADYNELLKKAENSAEGFIKIIPESQDGLAIQSATESLRRLQGVNSSDSIFKTYDFYVKKKR